jgi:hypothetical protein
VEFLLEFMLDLLPRISPGVRLEDGGGARAPRLLLNQDSLWTEEAQVPVGFVYPITLWKR